MLDAGNGTSMSATPEAPAPKRAATARRVARCWDSMAMTLAMIPFDRVSSSIVRFSK